MLLCQSHDAVGMGRFFYYEKTERPARLERADGVLETMGAMENMQGFMSWNRIHAHPFDGTNVAVLSIHSS